MNIIINLIVGVFIIIVYWFFFGKKDQAILATKEILIKVAGGYKPDHIVVPNHKPIKLIFHRTDASSCMEEVVIPEFKVKQFLPLNKKTTITITPSKKGIFEISCGMNMYHAKIEVKD